MLGNCKSLFDNYCCEKIVFVDEVKPATMPYSFLLQILDKYRCEIHARYSNVFAVYDEIHISSVFPPELLYKNLSDLQDTTIDSLNQLLRRITTIVYHYKKNDKYCTFELSRRSVPQLWWFETKGTRRSWRFSASRPALAILAIPLFVFRLASRLSQST